MPGWTPAATRERIASRLGVEASSRAFTAALTAAEQLIEEVTGLKLGSSASETLRRHVEAPIYGLRVPPDVTGVTAVTPEVEGTPEVSEPGVIRLFNADGEERPWAEGTYTLTVDRGLVDIPERILEAVGLLTAHRLGVLDPDRSRYANLRLGAFAGNRVKSVTGVPEADSLLATYLYRPEVYAP